MRFSILVGFCLATLAGTAFAQNAPSQVLYLFDSSGSMNDRQGGEPRIDSAKRALLRSLETIAPGTAVGFRVFAHRVAQTNKQESCKDTELVAPISAQRTGAISTALERLNAKGYTPLAYSIEKSGGDFDLSTEANRVIILLSDGEETCGGDPAAELKKLYEKGIKVSFYAIGFNVDAKSRVQLQELAKLGNGEYFDAANAKELEAALIEATKKSLLIKKQKSLYGTEIRGGDAFESAVPLDFNKEYRLDHHQKAGFYDYFLFPLKKGQEITILLKTLESGIHIDSNGSARITGDPMGGYDFNAPDRSRIASGSEVGRYGKDGKIFNAGEDGTYYLLVGTQHYALNKDGFTFSVQLQLKGDLDTQEDAGDTFKTALPIEPKNYEKNFIGGNDAKDLFSFSAAAGDSVVVTVLPSDGVSGYFKARLLTSLRQELQDASSPNSGAGFKTKPTTLTEEGTYYIEISNSGSNALQEYSIDLKIQRKAIEGSGGEGGGGAPAAQ